MLKVGGLLKLMATVQGQKVSKVEITTFQRMRKEKKWSKNSYNCLVIVRIFDNTSAVYVHSTNRRSNKLNRVRRDTAVARE